MGVPLWTLLCAGLTVAQEPGIQRFDAVSIKPASRLPNGVGPRGPNLFSVPFATLAELVAYAYQIPAYRVLGGPRWVTSERFEVLAKTSGGLSRGQMRRLLQELLGDRFSLRVHRETLERPVYNLVFARADRRFGSGLRVASVDCGAFRSGQRPMSESPVMVLPGGDTFARCAFAMFTDMRTGARKQSLNGVAMEEFVDFLARTTGRDVRDETGLVGVFDFDFVFVPDMPNGLGLPQTSQDGPALMTALTEQLGLKLESSNRLVEVLVIDDAKRPTPN